MAEIVMSRKAYVKPLLHALKYPHCSVNGVLLAELHKHKEEKVLKLVDALPLFHSSLTLAPMMEVALSMIDSYCQSKGLVVAGYYQANENFGDGSPAGIACRIADKIRENANGETCLMMIENEKSISEDECAYYPYLYVDSKWKKSDRRISFDADLPEIVLTLVQSRIYRNLIDFDNHLDDISLDWRNLEIDEQILSCT